MRTEKTPKSTAGSFTSLDFCGRIQVKGDRRVDLIGILEVFYDECKLDDIDREGGRI